MAIKDLMKQFITSSREPAAPLPGPEKPEPTPGFVAHCVRCEQTIPVGHNFPSVLCICADCLAKEKALAESPTGQPHGPWSYTGDEDGDFIIWENEAFVANVGGSSFVPIPPTQVAFDVDKAHAELIVKAVNAYLGGVVAQTATAPEEK